VLLRLIRSLDGIIYSLIATVLLLVHPSLGRDELGHLDLIAILPLAAIAFFAARIPLRYSQIPDCDARLLGGLITWSPRWPAAIFRLRLFAFALAALSPLAILWTTLPESRYLMHNAFWTIVAAFGLLFNVLMLANQLAAATRQPDLAAEARNTALFVFYMLFGAHLALSTLFLGAGWTAIEIFDTLTFGSMLLKLALGSMTLYVVSILLRVQYGLAREAPPELRPPAVAKSAHPPAAIQEPDPDCPLE
jgi:hypothetical protein